MARNPFNTFMCEEYESMKIVVAGRFEYIRFAWKEAIESGTALYFTDGVFRTLTFWNRVRAKLESVLATVFKKKAADFSARSALREYFDIDSLKKNDEILFVVYETNFLSTEFRLLNYLKKSFPKAKFVLHFTNAVGTVRDEATKLLLKNRDFYDLIYTFNKFDADKYGFRLFADISGNFSSVNAADCEDFDVFFCGKDKGRLDQLLAFAKKCISLGLKIRFHIVDVPPEKQVPLEGIYYNQPLSYEKMLSYEKRGKAILNIMQGVSSGIGLREDEAIGMNKVLITDTDYIFASEYYTEAKVIPLNQFEKQLDKLNMIETQWSASTSSTNKEAFLRRVFTDLNSKKTY